MKLTEDLLEDDHVTDVRTQFYSQDIIDLRYRQLAKNILYQNRVLWTGYKHQGDIRRHNRDRRGRLLCNPGNTACLQGPHSLQRG